MSDDSDNPYRQILEAAPDAMVIVGPDSTITFVNRQTETLFGYSQAELVGSRLEALIPNRFRGTHGDHIRRYFASPTVRPMGSGLSLFGRRKDGSEMQIEVSLSPVQMGTGPAVAAAIRDISERKKIEAIAKLNAERLSSAVESIQDALALYDAADRLAMCNSACRALLCEAVPGPMIGLSFAELFDQWMDHLAFTTDEERRRFRTERLAERSDPKVAYDVRTRDGRSLRVTNRRTLEGGIVQTIWDLSDDVRREEELREARALAEAGSAAKSEFLSSMSHELRTPLNAILGFAQLLQRDKKEPLSNRHKERAEHIVKGGEHLLRLIDDILDLSKIEAGGVSISTEPVNALGVLEEVKTTLDATAIRGGVSLNLERPARSIPDVMADRTRLLQILMNFGSNAIKYNRPGGSVTLTVSVATPERVRVVVSDTGVGIPLEKQDKLFQPFQRAGQETGPIQGTGIGLVITKRLAELMGGRVGFESFPGQGSSFWLDMPIHEHVSETIVVPQRPVQVPTELASTASRHILYVEDNPANVAFMRDLLDGFEKLELATAPTAEMGIELARQRKPDAIIMDINLPGMSGIDALRILRDDPKTAHIPIVALTAAASERDKQRGVQAGFYRYLTKPVKVDELMAAIESLLK